MTEHRCKWLFAVLLLAGGILASGASQAAAAGKRAPALPRACSFSSGQLGTPTALTAPLDPSLTSTFAVLRRADGPEDALPPINPLGEDLSFEVSSYFPAYIRELARDADGERYFLIPGFARGFQVPPAQCLPPPVRRHRSQLVAEQRKRESQPVYCIDAIGPRRPQYGGVNCQPFSAIQIGSRFLATAMSLSDVLELVPDGVATVRLTYRSGTVINAGVSNNAPSFLPPQRPIKQARARLRRVYRALSRTSFGKARSLIRLIERTLARLVPEKVGWIDASGQTIRSFTPKPPDGGSVLSGGSVVIGGAIEIASD